MPSKKKQQVYAMSSNPLGFELSFYEAFDEFFLFNLGITIWSILSDEEVASERINKFMIEAGGEPVSKHYLDALKANLFFLAMQQIEGFFALLIAPFGPVPTWIYLTEYQSNELHKAMELYRNRRVSELTAGAITTFRHFISETIYSGSMPTDETIADRWEENLDNIDWLIERMLGFYIENLEIYNSFKHGLRTCRKTGIKRPEKTQGQVRPSAAP